MQNKLFAVRTTSALAVFFFISVFFVLLGKAAPRLGISIKFISICLCRRIKLFSTFGRQHGKSTSKVIKKNLQKY